MSTSLVDLSISLILYCLTSLVATAIVLENWRDLDNWLLRYCLPAN